jgi:hypothetical protein
MKKTEDTNKIIKRCLSTPNMLHVREAAEGEAPSRTIRGTQYFSILRQSLCGATMTAKPGR